MSCKRGVKSPQITFVTEMLSVPSVVHLSFPTGTTASENRQFSSLQLGFLARFSSLKILSILTTNRTERCLKRYLNTNIDLNDAAWRQTVNQLSKTAPLVRSSSSFSAARLDWTRAQSDEPGDGTGTIGELR